MSDPWASVRPPLSPDETVAATNPLQGRRVRRNLPHISIDFGGAFEPQFSESGAVLSTDLEVVGHIGEGGMGTVLLARQHALQRDVAVKTLKDGAPPQAHAQLLGEGIIGGGLEHPGIVPVHSLGLDETGRPLLVMKRVEGVAWSELIQDDAHPAWDDWAGTRDDSLVANLEVLMQLCNAVHFANSRNVVHRDIKPSNVLIGRFGDVYLADWGVALRFDQLTGPQPFAGTPVFAAPEMVSGDGLGAHTDVYLLGATLHLLLVDEPRHAAETSLAAMAKAVHSKPYNYPADVPSELSTLANRATALDATQRPPTAAAFRQAIADFLQHRNALALSAAATERLAALRQLLDEVDDVGEGDAEQWRRIDETAAHAHFGMTQALELWEDNQQAIQGLAELNALLTKRRERAAQLERIAKDLDPRRAQKQRNILGSVIVVLGIALGVNGLLAWRSGTPWTADEVVVHGIGVFAVVCILSLLLRRQLRQSRVNRSVAAMAITTTGLIAAGRALGWYTHEPVAQMLAQDALIASATAAMGATFLPRTVLPVVVVMLGCAGACHLWPDRATAAFAMSTMLSFLFGLYTVWRLAPATD